MKSHDHKAQKATFLERLPGCVSRRMTGMRQTKNRPAWGFPCGAVFIEVKPVGGDQLRLQTGMGVIFSFFIFRRSLRFSSPSDPLCSAILLASKITAGLKFL